MVQSAKVVLWAAREQVAAARSGCAGGSDEAYMAYPRIMRIAELTVLQQS